MTQKFKDLFALIKMLCFENQEISIIVGILFLFLLIKRTKITIKFLLFVLLGLCVWFWFTSGFEGRNENKKFKRYKQDRVQDTIDEDGQKTVTPKNKKTDEALE
jgi:Gpi18-like mannosyltransferase